MNIVCAFAHSCTGHMAFTFTHSAWLPHAYSWLKIVGNINLDFFVSTASVSTSSLDRVYGHSSGNLKHTEMLIRCQPIESDAYCTLNGVCLREYVLYAWFFCSLSPISCERNRFVAKWKCVIELNRTLMLSLMNGFWMCCEAVIYFNRITFSRICGVSTQITNHYHMAIRQQIVANAEHCIRRCHTEVDTLFHREQFVGKLWIDVNFIFVFGDSDFKIGWSSCRTLHSSDALRWSFGT